MKELFIILSFFLWNQCTNAQCSDFVYAPEMEELQSFLSTIEKPNEPGFVLCVLYQDSIVFQEAQGLADLKTQMPISVKTPFYIASVGKTFTAAAVLRLWEEKALRLDDRITQYLPDLPKCMHDIRIFHLLNHTSGIPDHYDVLGEDLKDFSNSTVLEYVSGVDQLKFEPGVSYAYSNSAYVLLAIIIEKVTGDSFARYLKVSIFDPLDMATTVVIDQPEVLDFPRAKGYRFDEDQEGFIKDDYEGIYTYGAGGIYSTLEDLTKWYFALRKGKVLSSRSRELMWHFPITTAGKSSWLAMGWTNETFGKGTPELRGLRTIGSIGSLKGFIGIMNVFQDHDFGYILLCNRGDWPFERQVASDFFKRE